MSLRSSSQQPPGIYLKCDRLQPRINPSPRICYPRAIPLSYVADEFDSGREPSTYHTSWVAVELTNMSSLRKFFCLNFFVQCSFENNLVTPAFYCH